MSERATDSGAATVEALRHLIDQALSDAGEHPGLPTGRLHRIVARVSASGHGQILLDGRPLVTTGFSLSCGVNEVPQVTLAVPVEDLLLEAEGNVTLTAFNAQACAVCGAMVWPGCNYCPGCGIPDPLEPITFAGEGDARKTLMEIVEQEAARLRASGYGGEDD